MEIQQPADTLILVHELEIITTKPLVVNLAVHIIAMHRRLQLVYNYQIYH